MARAVFLNHLGTLVRDDRRVLGPGDVELVKGAASAIASLRGLGLHVVVASNQPDVAHGRCGEAEVDSAHERIAELVHHTAGGAIDRFYYCPFDPAGSVDRYRRDHPWRLPHPGMFQQAADDLGLDLATCWMIGRTVEDLGAARAAGMRSVLVRTDGGTAVGEAEEADLTATNLIEAVRLIAQQPRRARGIRKPAVVVEERVGAAVEAAIGAGMILEETASAVSGETAEIAPDQAEHSLETGSVESVNTSAGEEAAGDSPIEAVAGYDREEREIGGPDPESAMRIRRVAIDLSESRAEAPAAAEDESNEREGPVIETVHREEPALSRAETAGSEREPAVPSGDGPVGVAVEEPANESTEAAAPANPTPVTTGSPIPERRRSARSPLIPADRGSAGDSEQTELLRQILSALKRQSADRGDFSVRQMLANFVFMLSLLCVVVAVIFRDQPTAFMQWMAGAVVALLFMLVLLIGDQKR